MAWAKEKVLLPDLPTKVSTEKNWESTYPNSLERWTKDFSVSGFVLDAEYDLGNNKTLYRFKSDKGLFQNVVILQR